MDVLIIHANSFIAADIAESVKSLFPKSRVMIGASFPYLENALSAQWVPSLAIIEASDAKVKADPALTRFFETGAAIVLINGAEQGTVDVQDGWIGVPTPFSESVLNRAIKAAMEMSKNTGRGT